MSRRPTDDEWRVLFYVHDRETDPPFSQSAISNAVVGLEKLGLVDRLTHNGIAELHVTSKGLWFMRNKDDLDKIDAWIDSL